jgi:hypothetical protein
VRVRHKILASDQLEVLEREISDAIVVYEQIPGDLFNIVQEREVVGLINAAIVLLTHSLVILVLFIAAARRADSIERIEVGYLQIAVDVDTVRVDCAPLEVVVYARAEQRRSARTDCKI